MEKVVAHFPDILFNYVEFGDYPNIYMKNFRKTLSCIIACISTFTFLACSPAEVEGYSDIRKVCDDKIIDNEETRNLFIKLKPEKFKELVRTRILEEQKNIAAMPSIGTVKRNEYHDIPTEYPTYQSDVNRYNKLCIEMLSHAVALEDKQLANFIISSMKKNIEYRRATEDEYEVKLNTEDIDVAKQQCNALFN